MADTRKAPQIHQSLSLSAHFSDAFVPHFDNSLIIFPVYRFEMKFQKLKAEENVVTDSWHCLRYHLPSNLHSV